MATPIPKNEVAFTLGEIAEATSGRLVGGKPDAKVRGVTTDSRGVGKGALFVALRGDHHDGHAFAGRAHEAGAAAVLVEAGRSDVEPRIEVADTLVALGAIAKAHRGRFRGRVIALTGSVGKTTTKELIAAALAGLGRRVHKTEGNLNNRIGVPMTLLALDLGADDAVIELGTSAPGEIAMLAAITEPDVGLITAVGIAHAEGLGDEDSVAREKGALFDGVRSGGVVVANADDARVLALADRSPRRKVLFGVHPRADVRVLATELAEDGTQARLAIPGREDGLSIELPLLGTPAAVLAAAALAVVHALGEDLAEGARGLGYVQPPDGRMRPAWRTDGVLVIDDTYNASPRSMEAAIASVAEIARARGSRVVAVLGDMKELGAHSEDAHAEIGRQIAKADVAVFVATGADMAVAGDVARHSGVRVVPAADAEEASRAVDGLVEAGDLVLVKGSRSMAMERVVASLLGLGKS